MNPKTAKTFVWAAIISIIFGMLVMSPAGSLLLYSLAALFGAIPAIFGAKGTRIAAIVLLAITLALLAVTYPKYDAEMTRYKERTHKKYSEISTPRQEASGNKRKSNTFPGIYDFIFGIAAPREKYSEMFGVGKERQPRRKTGGAS